MSEENLVIEKVNDVYMKVHCEPGLAFELSEYFTFSVPGAKHMPMFKIKCGMVRSGCIIQCHVHCMLD